MSEQRFKIPSSAASLSTNLWTGFTAAQVRDARLLGSHYKIHTEYGVRIITEAELIELEQQVACAPKPKTRADLKEGDYFIGRDNNTYMAVRHLQPHLLAVSAEGYVYPINYASPSPITLVRNFNGDPL